MVSVIAIAKHTANPARSSGEGNPIALERATPFAHAVRIDQASKAERDFLQRIVEGYKPDTSQTPQPEDIADTAAWPGKRRMR